MNAISEAALDAGLRQGAGMSSARNLARRDFTRFFANALCVTGLALGDLAALSVASFVSFFAVLWMRGFGFHLGVDTPGIDQLTAAAPEIGLIWVASLGYFIIAGHYSKPLPFWSEIRGIVGVSCLALIATGFLEFVLREGNSRQFLIGTWVLSMPMMVLSRLALKHGLMKAGLWNINVLLIGDQQGIAKAHELLETDRNLGLRIVGAMTPEDLHADPVFWSFTKLLGSHAASRVILALDANTDYGQQVIAELIRQRVSFSLIPQVVGVPVVGFEQIEFFGSDGVLLTYRSNVGRPFARIAKTIIDVGGAALLLFLLMPVMLLTAVLVSLDGGPILFRHRRVGAGGKTFNCLKFRTMDVKAASILRDLLDRDPAARIEWQETQKLTNDPRITRVGHFLRKASLDELPQLFNVLQMEMSLVGPRPIVEQEVVRYGENINLYYGTKPGLTGLWQVSGRSDTTYDKRVQLDCWYVRNWSVWTDLAILMKTIPAVLRRQGAK